LKRIPEIHIVNSIVIPALVYFLLDAPARLSGFMNLPGFTGPKNFLPMTFGLLAGPWSAAGMCIGAAAATVLAGGTFGEMAAEAVGIAIMAVFSWILWYRKADRPFCLKKGREYLRFLGIAVVLSVLSGLPGQFLLGGRSFAETAFSYLAFTVFVGIPVLILTTSIFCLHPYCPAEKETPPDVAETIAPDAGRLEETNDRIGDFYTAHGLPLRQSLSTQNCLEEFVVRIQAGAENCPIDIRLYIRDAVALEIAYRGKKYNPLRREKNEKDEDLFALLLIRQHALRASYQYSGNVNSLHIVI
jgi:hypothetical protein